MGRNTPRPGSSRSWDRVADWYAGWVGPNGSEHHRRVAIPAVLELLRPDRGEHILDLGCGPGVLAPHVTAAGADYTGVDSSRRLIAYGQRHHGRHGRFVRGDVTRLADLVSLAAGSFDAAVFMLSIQDISPLAASIAGAARLLRERGRLVILMTHPCFRVPRQSGWGWDPDRKLMFRRVDAYLGKLAVPMKRYGGERGGATRSYHRPLHCYVDELRAAGMLVDRITEVPTYDRPRSGPRAKARRLADRQIPLFLGIRALKL